MGKNFHIRAFLSVTVLLAGAVLLAACGDSATDKAKTKKAVAKVRTFYTTKWNRPSPDWEIRKIRPGKESAIAVEIKIRTRKLTKAIMERSKAEQMEIARLACPPYTDPIWTDIAMKQSVAIVLSGSAGHIINALCKRP